MYNNNNNLEAFPRLLAYLFLTKAGLIMVGVISIVSGIIFGWTSHTVTYQQQTLAAYKVYTLDDNIHYIFQDPATRAFYTADLTQFRDDFSPMIDPSASTAYKLVLVYNANLQNVEVSQDDGTTLKASSYPILKLSFLDAQNQLVKSYESTDYQQHHQTYYVNHWQIGGIAAGGGVLVILLTLIISAQIARWDKQHLPKQLPAAELANFYQKQTRDPWSRNGLSRGSSNFKDLAR